MAGQYHIRDEDSIYFLTLTVIEWIDVFTRKDYRDIILKNLSFCRENKGLKLHAFVIMSNHLHLLASSNQKSEKDLGDIIRDFKKHTANELYATIRDNPKESRREWITHKFEWYGKTTPGNKNIKFWKDGNHPIPIYGNTMMDEKMDYIHLNPVRAGYVSKASDWLYSSAIDYSGGKGLIELDMID